MQLMADAMIDRHSRGSSFRFSCRQSMRSLRMKHDEGSETRLGTSCHGALAA
jgi:hypothetical protein